MNKTYFTLLFCLFVFQRSQAQNDTSNTIGKVSIASPTAASLGKYGDIPVSYHTGIPDISIPIYTIKSGSLQLPVGLSYHASGLKVQEAAGWVGAGWALNAGGAITRTVVGAADDRGLSTSIVLKGHYTDYGYNSYYPDNDMGVMDLDLTRGMADGEPDLYFFNFGGYTGKFYFNDDRTPMLVPEQDLKIQPFLTDGRGFIGFIVTTPDGVKYYFGAKGNNGPVDPIEITNPFTLQYGPSNSSAANSSWFLNKIVSADGMDSITLTYAQENYSYYAVATSPVSNDEYLQYNAGQQFSYGMNLTKNLVQGVRLTGISFANGSMLFTPAATPRIDLSNSNGVLVTNSMTDVTNTSAYALGSVTITDNKGFCKKDSLFTSYFYDNSYLYGDFISQYSNYNLHTDEYRLRLDSIRETSCDASLRVPPYRFTYFGEKVPRRLNFGVDHWGFPNGVDTNKTMVPTFTVITNSVPTVKYGANRDAAWPAMRGGSLARIDYPTGGNTAFDFEAKDSYTFNSSELEDVRLTGAVVHTFGQGNISQTVPFTLNSDGVCTIQVQQFVNSGSTPDAEPDLRITNSSNQEVYFSGYISPMSYNTTISLPAGDYQAKLEYMNVGDGSGLNCGSTARIGQMRYVPVSTTLLAGGLRIKTITSNDALTSTPVVKSFNYTGGGSTSTGVLYSRPVYVQILRNDVMRTVFGPINPVNLNGCASIDGANAHLYYVSAGSIQPLSTVQGENVGYNEVDVSQTGNGKTVYRYYGSNMWGQSINDVCTRTLTQSSLCDPNIPTYPAAPLPFEFMRDELEYEGYFNQNGTILKEAYHYPLYSPDPLVTPGHIGINITGFFTYTEYALQTAKKVRDSVATVTYDAQTGNTITTTSATYYGSPWHTKPTRAISYSSKGELLATNTKYAMDFRIPSCDAIPDSLGYYQGAVHNDTVWLSQNVDVCTPQSVSGSLILSCRHTIYAQFREMLAQDRVNFIRWRRNSYAADSANLLSSCYLNTQNSSDAHLTPILRLQQEYNNPPIEVSHYKGGKLLGAAFTQYSNSVFPTGFAYPGKTQQVNLQAPATSFTDASVSGNSIVRDARYLDETQLLFSAGDLQQATAHDGVTTAYLWDYTRTLPVAKVVNATQDQIAYSSFEADGNGGWTMSGVTTDNTSAITGRKSGILNSGTISKGGLGSGNSYFVSFWMQTTSHSGLSIAGTMSGYPKVGKTVFLNNIAWTLFVYKVTGQSTISISGSGHIDELRLYPAAAQMTTYTYDPLVGMTSQTDAGNRVTYYEYDGLARLKRIRDQDFNILKSYEYQYQAQAGCGSGCAVLAMQTFLGAATIGYPVGVFNVHGKLLGNATGPDQYVSLWNNDTANAAIGTLAKADSLHFKLSVNAGKTAPPAVTGCRYYQYDLAWNYIDGIRMENGCYVDFGDGTGTPLPGPGVPAPASLPPNTTVSIIAVEFGPNGYYYVKHSYPDTSLKTITIYHDDNNRGTGLDNVDNPATSLTKLRNFRGSFPQYNSNLTSSCYQDASVLTVANLTNWNTISTIQQFWLHDGDAGTNPCMHVSYAQDFMANNRGLKVINTTNGYNRAGYRDSTFKLSRLKSDWNTWFTQLQDIEISDEHWDREDLSGLTHLTFFVLIAGNQNHSNNLTNNPITPIPPTAVDSILNQIAAGSGQVNSNGVIVIWGYQPQFRTSASDGAFDLLKSKHWTIYYNGTIY